jgi:predicted RNase H-like HicB family nuclease
MFVLPMTQKKIRNKMSFTAIYQKVPEGYIAFVQELPGANTQGETLEAARKNLKEAIKLVLEANKQLTEDEIAGKEVIREEIEVSV